MNKIGMYINSLNTMLKNVSERSPVCEKLTSNYYYRIWDSGICEFWGIYETTPSSSDWKVYVDQNLYYTNITAGIPDVFREEPQFVEANIRNCGTNVGWCANSRIIGNNLIITVVRNGNTGLLSIQYHLIGR